MRTQAEVERLKPRQIYPNSLTQIVLGGFASAVGRTLSRRACEGGHFVGLRKRKFASFAGIPSLRSAHRPTTEGFAGLSEIGRKRLTSTDRAWSMRLFGSGRLCARSRARNLPRFGLRLRLCWLFFRTHCPSSARRFHNSFAYRTALRIFIDCVQLWRLAGMNLLRHKPVMMISTFRSAFLKPEEVGALTNTLLCARHWCLHK